METKTIKAVPCAHLRDKWCRVDPYTSEDMVDSLFITLFYIDLISMRELEQVEIATREMRLDLL